MRLPKLPKLVLQALALIGISPIVAQARPQAPATPPPIQPAQPAPGSAAQDPMVEVKQQAPGIQAAETEMKKAEIEKPVALEGATVEQLTAVEGVGPVRAEALVAHMKAEGPFNTWDEVRDVKGVGSVTIKALKDAGVLLKRTGS